MINFRHLQLPTTTSWALKQIFWFQYFFGKRNFLPIEYLPVQKMETLQNKFKLASMCLTGIHFAIMLYKMNSQATHLLQYLTKTVYCIWTSDKYDLKLPTFKLLSKPEDIPKWLQICIHCNPTLLESLSMQTRNLLFSNTNTSLKILQIWKGICLPLFKLYLQSCTKRVFFMPTILNRVVAILLLIFFFNFPADHGKF